MKCAFFENRECDSDCVARKEFKDNYGVSYVCKRMMDAPTSHFVTVEHIPKEK